MFENELLNLLSIYSLIKFAEQPKEARVFDEVIGAIEAVEEEDEDEEVIL